MSENSADAMTQEERALAIERLYKEAFARFGGMALWNRKPVPSPDATHALIVARQLRLEGNMAARRLAEKIEALCRADQQNPSQALAAAGDPS